MESTFNDKKLVAFLKGMTQEERSWLLRELLADQWQHPDVAQVEATLAAERWFMDRCLMTTSPRQLPGRQKFLGIFLLLRYGGLRLAEITNLARRNIDLEKGIIAITANKSRIVPLPLPVVKRLACLCQSCLVAAEALPFHHDASQFRRLLKACAHFLELDKNALTVRSIRRLRSLELQRLGIHPQLVNYFFHGGKGTSSYFHNPDLLLTRQIQEELKMSDLFKTSARNIFRGKIIEMKKQGLLVEVKLKTEDNFTVCAIITQESQENLKLAEDMPITALVKAPWVKLFSGSQPQKPDDNIYEAEIESFRTEGDATEIMLKANQNTFLCSLYVGEKPDVELAVGKNVTVCISAFAIILVTG